jgi:hypothetical protein
MKMAHLPRLRSKLPMITSEAELDASLLFRCRTLHIHLFKAALCRRLFQLRAASVSYAVLQHMFLHKIDESDDIIDIQAGNFDIQRPVAGNGNQVIVFGTEKFMLQNGPHNLYLGVGIDLESFGEDDVRMTDVSVSQFFQSKISVHIFNNRNPLRRCDNRRSGTCLLVAPTVLAFMIDIEAMKVMLDGSHPVSPPDQFRNHLLYQGRLPRI